MINVFLHESLAQRAVGVRLPEQEEFFWWEKFAMVHRAYDLPG
jgi:hypothetical protein